MKLVPVCVLIFALLLGDAAAALNQGRGEQGQSQSQNQNPYVFEDEHFTTKIQTEHGRVRVLPRFSERSELLEGLDNYRIAVLEAEPNTFIVPNHMDAEAVIFVKNGNGAVNLLFEDRRENFDIRRGDIFRIPAGITAYLVNKDNNERLILVKLIQPVFSPGRFENFFGAGGEDPESFYKAFSNEVLEAVFNTRGQAPLQRIFGRQRQGVIIKVSEQQIRALSQQHEGTHVWPFHRESESKFNIFDKRPSVSNQFGKLYEVDFNDFRQLQDLNVAIGVTNVTRGGMTAPIFGTKATKWVFVLGGDGYFEMACPHLSSALQQGGGSQPEHGSAGWQRQGQGQEQGGSAPTYERVSGRLRRNTLVIVPPGHPFVVVASQNQNLELFCFETNAFGSVRIRLSGIGNVFSQLDRPAKEIAFGVPAREVEEFFNRQQEGYFFRGPQQQPQQQGEESGRAEE